MGGLRLLRALFSLRINYTNVSSLCGGVLVILDGENFKFFSSASVGNVSVQSNRYRNLLPDSTSSFGFSFSPALRPSKSLSIRVYIALWSSVLQKITGEGRKYLALLVYSFWLARSSITSDLNHLPESIEGCHNCWFDELGLFWSPYGELDDNQCSLSDHLVWIGLFCYSDCYFFAYFGWYQKSNQQNCRSGDFLYQIHSTCEVQLLCVINRSWNCPCCRVGNWQLVISEDRLGSRVSFTIHLIALLICDVA